MNKKAIVFIINPISGIGKQKKVESLVPKLLDNTKFDVEFYYTNKRGHATELARKANENGATIVVAVGGDGTVHEVAQALIHSNCHLAILPTGSGNGIARHHQIPLQLEQAIKLINQCNSIKIDTAEINNTPFLMTVGCGFDALIADKFAHLKKRGLSGYVKLIVKHLYHYKAENYQLIIDEIPYHYKAFLVSIANCSQYGNNAFIAPRASTVDGELNVTVLKKFPFWAAFSILIKLFTQKLDSSQYVETFKGKKISLNQTSELIQLDGESMLVGKKISIHIVPASLHLLVPKAKN